MVLNKFRASLWKGFFGVEATYFSWFRQKSLRLTARQLRLLVPHELEWDDGLAGLLRFSTCLTISWVCCSPFLSTSTCLGTRDFLLLLANYPFWAEVVHKIKMPGSSTSGLKLSLSFIMVLCGRHFLGCVGLVRQCDTQLELFCLAASSSSS